jgi:hypothetical protein
LVPLTAKQVRFDDQTGLSASKWGFVPDLDLLASFLHDLHHENDVSGMVPGGLNGRVPVPPEKRFLIHGPENRVKHPAYCEVTDEDVSAWGGRGCGSCSPIPENGAVDRAGGVWRGG